MSTRDLVPDIFLYLDEEGIESLYAQTTERVETELTTSSEKGRESSVSAKIGLGEIFRVLFGLGSVEATGELGFSRKRIDEAKFHLTTEHKLFAVAEYLRKFEGQTFTSELEQAKAMSRESGGPIFVQLTELFEVPQFHDGGGGVEAVNKLGTVLFEIGNPRHPRIRNIDYNDEYDWSDSYFKHKDLPIAEVFMAASLTKFTRSRGHMTSMGHDALLFTVHRGHRIRLNVMGYLTSIADLYYQIKPYGVWL